MRRFWEIINAAEGSNRFYCFPFLFLFWCVTPLYQFVSRINLKKRQKRCSRHWKGKVISIGSVMIGGSGKTPLTIWLARRFIRSGKKVVIVHSGYGRRIDDEIIIDYRETAKFTPDRIGDETAMMMQELPEAGFAVGSDKKRMLIRADLELTPDIIIIDDGFQRLDIEKDLDLAVVDQAVLKGDETGPRVRDLRLFPSGKLREPLSSLQRAEALFVINSQSSSATNNQVSFWDSNKPTIIWDAKLSGVTLNGKNMPIESLKNHKPFLFAGLGSYDRLLSMLASNGINLAGEYNFGDHYDYDKSDIGHLKDMAKTAKADGYLTTAKDMVKLIGMNFDLPVYCLMLSVEPQDLSALDRVLEFADR